MVDIEQETVLPANAALTTALDVIVCTTRQRHLLGHLALPPGSLQHHATHAEPLLLGIECQSVLRDCLGGYDFYGFMEDDLIARDPWMFRKLAWFCASFGDAGTVCKPNKASRSGLWVLCPRSTSTARCPRRPRLPFQDIREEPNSFLRVSSYAPVGFLASAPGNPHAGCYFLNARQMEHWSRQGHFLDRDTSFIGPLESAASLGIMRTFRVYKPQRGNASFLEIEHFGSEFLNLIVAAGGV